MNDRSHLFLSLLLISIFLLPGSGCIGKDLPLKKEPGVDIGGLVNSSTKSIPTVIFDEYVYIDKNRTDLKVAQREQLKYDYREREFYIDSCKVGNVVDNREKKNNPGVLIVLDCGIKRKYFFVYLKPKEVYYKKALAMESGDEITFVAKIDNIYDMVEDQVWFYNGVFIEDKYKK